MLRFFTDEFFRALASTLGARLWVDDLAFYFVREAVYFQGHFVVLQTPGDPTVSVAQHRVDFGRLQCPFFGEFEVRQAAGVVYHCAFDAEKL